MYFLSGNYNVPPLPSKLIIVSNFAVAQYTVTQSIQQLHMFYQTTVFKTITST